MMWSYGNNPMLWGFGWLGMLWAVVWWVLIIAVIILAIKWLIQQSNGKKSRCHECDHGEKSPLEILKERYARGEIDRKEFEERKKDLA